MSGMRLRSILAVAAACAAAAFMLYGVVGLSPFGSYPGPYGDIIARVGVMQRHALNVATAINFDYRGFDTLIEEYILFTAVAGVTLLFREQLRPHERIGRDPDVERPIAPQSDGIGWLAYGLLPIGTMFAIYLALHGQLTPGGGFQAGAIAASTFVLIYLGLGYSTMRRFMPREVADLFEAAGASGYALVGVAAAVASGAFLTNVLPLGKTGNLLSAGTIPLINACVFIEVTFGLIVAVMLFMQQTRKTEGKE